MRPRLAAFTIVLAACNSGFEPQYLVTDLRVLAMSVQVQGSTAADGTPGDTLDLAVLVANPTGRTGVTVTWYGCLPTPDETLSPCADPALLKDPSMLDADARVLKLGTCEPVDGVCGTTYTIPNGDLDAALDFIVSVAEQEPAYKCRLYAEMPVLAVAEAEGQRDIALKRVRLTLDPDFLLSTEPQLAGAYVLNHNPVPLEIVRASDYPIDGCGAPDAAAISSEPFPMGETILCGDAPVSSAETFNVCSEKGELEPTLEDLSWQWFTTGGEFPDFGEGIGNATGGRVDFVRPRAPFTLWAIVRDGRGGEVWLQREVNAAP